MERQLHNTENYKRLNHNPTITNNKPVNKIIKSSKVEGLKIESPKSSCFESPKSSCFYLKLKLRKEGIPRRSLINLVNCHTSEISEYFDYHLQPILKKIPFYHKDKVTSYEKLTQLNSSQITSTLYHLM